uniref:Uncharacterized protein n=1 Tax=Natrinema halophilum TaxID=1699371 RepID=A0A7D5GIE3_9EURY
MSLSLETFLYVVRNSVRLFAGSEFGYVVYLSSHGGKFAPIPT